ncbi:TetR/AcrR family transcriptional regulator [Frankia sp. AgB1.9]|uniref:TetR/AcrR family transcriptional regulator n=1 Tax=unclassified Frankia TaxID=2632575 RepID=UPI0019317101|nr:MULTISPECIES: TetR/AcrR family transcriptional regulator [unclassified Frankia]MBL7490707.1 TetR/AcrR family transcriptional regulator [Frankia sp. AgW1.1]MBL7547717.1 TetR/AcrR family transcriptional regulator [Frankia sp. AgB1.9]MBL7622641.1 TetR/AcrR family transcriptional regulator [Frankia sp. AgB1.8]
MSASNAAAREDPGGDGLARSRRPSSPSTTEAAGVTSGRPRDLSIDERVLATTRAQLLSLGYTDMSLGTIAREAGVNRPAIYRRWPSKMHLVFDAVAPAAPTVKEYDSGDFERDLRDLIRRAAAFFDLPEVRAALPGLMADVGSNEALRVSVVERLETEARHRVTHLVALATERGQIVPGVDVDALFDSISGALIYRLVLRDQPSSSFADTLAGLLLQPIMRAPLADQPE